MKRFPRALALAAVLPALAAGAVRAAPSWEEEIGARADLQARIVGRELSRFVEDEIQRLAQELMKTVRPASEWKKGEPVGKFLDTYYFNVLESDYPGPQTVAVKDGKGKIIAWVTPGFWEHLSVEGTGRLRDGREINTSEGGFIFVDAPMGEGSCPLQAWRTMAVDSRVIPLGTIVKIDETVGLKLPDGTVHDGYWQAEDTGGEVRNAHVDLYIGDGEKGGATLDAAGIHLKALTVRYVETPAATCAKLARLAPR